MIERKHFRFGGIALAALLMAGACSSGASPTPIPTGTVAPTGTQATDEPTSGTVSGTIKVTGSSTVEPISFAVSEAFKALNPDFGFQVDGPGTGDGFADFFCTGEYDVNDASRAIKEEEAAACQAAGVEYAELKIGFDGITVFTSPDTQLDCLNLNDLYALFGPESSEFATWEDAQALAQELGSTTIFPTGPLAITAPGEESGTYTSFIDLALVDILEARGQEAALGTHYTPSPNDNVIVENVSGTPNSLGFAGYAFYANNQDRLKAISVDGGDGCTDASHDTIADGSFPLSRPLFIYPNTLKAADNAALTAWVDFYLSDEGIANVTGEGYVELPTDELDATRQAWDGARP